MIRLGCRSNHSQVYLKQKVFTCSIIHTKTSRQWTVLLPWEICTDYFFAAFFLGDAFFAFFLGVAFLALAALALGAATFGVVLFARPRSSSSMASCTFFVTAFLIFSISWLFAFLGVIGLPENYMTLTHIIIVFK